MRLNLVDLPLNPHKDVVTGCAWSPSGTLFTTSDDNTIHKFSIDGESQGKVMDVDFAVTCVSWMPKTTQRRGPETMACGCSDGCLRFIDTTGRVENRIQACEGGAVVSVAFNHDGSAVATGGEDGGVRVWSRAGMLRSNIANAGSPVHTVAWGPDNKKLLYAGGRELHIHADKGKANSWKAHDGVVLCADWSPVTGYIVSGGEDKRYRVWDQFGRQLFVSAPIEHVVTAAAWAPRGDVFAVAAYNLVKLCDKTGWSHCREAHTAGSIYQLAFTAEGTQLAGAGAAGEAMLAQVLGRRVADGAASAEVISPDTVNVEDPSRRLGEHLPCGDRVVQLSMSHDRLIVATASHCHIHPLADLHRTKTIDVKAAPSLILQSSQHFVLIDPVDGIRVFNGEGRLQCNPRFPGLRPHLLSQNDVSLSPDCLAILDKSDSKTVHVFELRSGRQVGKSLEHPSELKALQLSQAAVGLPQRRLAFIDSNNDLFITPVLQHELEKLTGMVDSFCWNNAAEMLVAAADGNQMVWLSPATMLVDRKLSLLAHHTRPAPEGGKLPQIVAYKGARCTIKRGDGAVIESQVDTYGPMLHAAVTKGDWAAAVRLCRFVQQPHLWAALASMALQAPHLDTAEIALSEVGLVDKVLFVKYVKEKVPSDVGKMAEMALYRRSINEAESILLQANPPLLYRALKVNIRMCRWLRALELAQQYRQHVDLVVAYRQRYLEMTREPETIEEFAQLASQVTVDWEAIAATKEREKQREAQAAAGAGGQ